jgi:hypothetical protein
LGVYGGIIAYRDKESCQCLCAFFVRHFQIEMAGNLNLKKEAIMSGTSEHVKMLHILGRWLKFSHY